jgi:hypothetical protein
MKVDLNTPPSLVTNPSININAASIAGGALMQLA